MANAKSVVPAPPNSDEKPFGIGERITVFDAAMIYAGRHPHGLFLKDGSVDDHLDFLRARFPEQPRSRDRARARRSWDISCELINRIQNRTIEPVRIAYQPSGEIDPTRTLIRTSDVASLARERGEQPKYLRHLLPVWEKTPAEELRLAPDAEIKKAIVAAYDNAEAQRAKPPNIKELPGAVRRHLKVKGYYASDKHIQDLGAPYKNRRRSPGKTLASDRRS